MKGSGSKSRKLSFLWIISVCVGLVLLDQATKWCVLRWLVRGEVVQVIPKFLSLTLAHNRGMAFGLLQGRVGLLVAVSIVAAVVLPILIERARRRRDGALAVYGLTAILAGAVGNLIDRLLRDDGVVDFLYVHLGDPRNPWWSWFPFNVADSAICVGVGMYLLAEWLNRPADD